MTAYWIINITKRKYKIFRLQKKQIVRNYVKKHYAKQNKQNQFV